jgi:anti-sigma factor RsiW
MHEPVIDSLEEILSGGRVAAAAQAHLNECASCRGEVAAMREQNGIFRALKSRTGMEPSPGFYARVIERIETQAKPSIWSIFGESMFAKRLAYVSMSVFVLLGTYVLSSTRSEQPLTVNAPEAIMADDDQVQIANNNPERDRETILVTLATYEE